MTKKQKRGLQPNQGKFKKEDNYSLFRKWADR
jgi:hypothetical protein